MIRQNIFSVSQTTMPLVMWKSVELHPCVSRLASYIWSSLKFKTNVEIATLRDHPFLHTHKTYMRPSDSSYTCTCAFMFESMWSRKDVFLRFFLVFFGPAACVTDSHHLSSTAPSLADEQGAEVFCRAAGYLFLSELKEVVGWSGRGGGGRGGGIRWYLTSLSICSDRNYFYIYTTNKYFTKSLRWLIQSVVCNKKL